ncbi:transmembrane protein 161B-like [Anneissia japonica]|uniref:transmembrane protein 161B-like n=1 Tax=Anneissia japonica TaxID=1529436 RepID=UPI0014256495|nr:transmembrane protein 161B-like [Anneissia japonica]
MALFGFQLVTTFIAVTALQKLNAYFSFAQWLIARGNLTWFKLPNEQEVRSQIKPENGKNYRRGRRGESIKDDSFIVPRSLDVQLIPRPVLEVHVIPLRYYSELQWLIDFTVVAVVVYITTACFYLYNYPLKEFNLSMVWVLVVLVFASKYLFSVLKMYFDTEEKGELWMCLASGLCFLLVAMGIMLIGDDILDFRLDEALHKASEEAELLLEQQLSVNRGPISKGLIKLSLAFTCGILGAVLTFPGLRIGKTHLDSLRYSSDRTFVQMLLHCNFILPVFLLLLWIKPLGRDYILSNDVGHLLTGEDKPIMSEAAFERGRLGLVWCFCLIRLFFLPTHLQSYLNMAQERLDQLRKEAGKLTYHQLLLLVMSVFRYLCVVAIQYIAPVIVIFSLSLLLNTSYGALQLQDLSDSNVASSSAVGGHSLPLLSYALISFMLWWACLAWLATSLLGVAYHSVL